MLIVCPTCASEYRIDIARIASEGRSVRCAACRETWFVTPADVIAARAAETEAAEAATGATSPETTTPEATASSAISDAAWQEAADAVRAQAEAGDIPPAAPPRRRGQPGRRATARRPRRGLSPALALGLCALAAVPLAGLARESVVRLAPRTGALYARLGLPVNVRGIEIRDVVALSSPTADGRPGELVVEGDLVGVGRSDVPVASLKVEIRDAGGKALATFPVAPPRAVLGPGETARFHASFPTLPAQGRAVELSFAEAVRPPGTRVASAGR